MQIWSPLEKRWIHADACENAVDLPLIYEKGWGKKLNYIIAFSKDEVQDVTWKYTREASAVMTRRMLISEEELSSLIFSLNEERMSRTNCSEAYKNFVTKRRLMELVDMLPPPPGMIKPSFKNEQDDNYGGRTSGSLAWRLSRGETNVEVIISACHYAVRVENKNET